MTTIASQITSLTVVYSTVYSDADKRKHQSSASLAFVWGTHRDRWISRSKGQLRGKCFHLMTSSWLLAIFNDGQQRWHGNTRMQRDLEIICLIYICIIRHQHMFGLPHSLSISKYVNISMGYCKKDVIALAMELCLSCTKPSICLNGTFHKAIWMQTSCTQTTILTNKDCRV